MSYSIHYFRPGARENAGFLIVTNESELPAYKARLEASGYIVLDVPVRQPLEAMPVKSL